MSVESGTKIQDLQAHKPDGAEPVSEGDDHLRLIKTVLTGSFPSSIAVQVPDITDNAGNHLAVSADGLSTEWVTGALATRNVERSRFSVVADELVADSGVYYIPANEGYTSWVAPLTASPPTGTGTARWLYAYIKADDNSLYLDNTEPTQNSSTGWFKNNDRCITAVQQNADNSLAKMYHDGGDYIMYADHFNADPLWVYGGAGWSNVVIHGPNFATYMELTFKLSQDGPYTNSTTYYARVEGDAGDGHLLGTVEGGGGLTQDEHVTSNKKFFVNPANRTIQINGVTNGGTPDGGCNTYINGFYFPSGL
jgi:hypothetical protein